MEKVASMCHLRCNHFFMSGRWPFFSTKRRQVIPPWSPALWLNIYHLSCARNFRQGTETKFRVTGDGRSNRESHNFILTPTGELDQFLQQIPARHRKGNKSEDGSLGKMVHVFQMTGFSSPEASVILVQKFPSSKLFLSSPHMLLGKISVVNIAWSLCLPRCNI